MDGNQSGTHPPLDGAHSGDGATGLKLRAAQQYRRALERAIGGIAAANTEIERTLGSGHNAAVGPQREAVASQAVDGSGSKGERSKQRRRELDLEP